MRSTAPAPDRIVSAGRRPRLGFVGMGWIGRHRLEAIARSGLADVVAVADAAADAASGAAALAPGAVRCESLDAVLARGVDGLVIATPNAFHAAQAIAALERGVAVFCQKPLGRTAAETRQVVAAAERADRLLGVDLSYRAAEGVRRIRVLVQDGALGELFAARLVFHNAYGPDKPWFYDAALAGGGCLIDLGIHLVDLAYWMFDSGPRTISGRLFAAGRPLAAGGPACEDYAVARIDLESGAVVEVACSWRLAAGCDAVIDWSFYGTHGGAALRNVDGSFYDFVAERFDRTSRHVLCEPPDAWGGRAAVEWVARLASGAGYDPEIARTIDVAKTLDRIYGRRTPGPLTAAFIERRRTARRQEDRESR